MLAVVEEKRVIPALSLTFQLFCGVQKFLPLAIRLKAKTALHKICFLYYVDGVYTTVIKIPPVAAGEPCRTIPFREPSPRVSHLPRDIMNKIFIYIYHNIEFINLAMIFSCNSRDRVIDNSTYQRE